MSRSPVLVIHGGAGQKPPLGERALEIRESLQRIVKVVYPKLERGMSAVKAVSLAASLLEDDPIYNAGRGSKIQRDGKIRMSASLMDGHRRRFAGCVNIEGVQNPIHVAQALMNEEDRVLSTSGARQFAREKHLPFRSPYTPQQKRAWLARSKGKTGTIGAVALDQKGRLAAATSTGGRGFEYPYRVSDSPTSAGNFANSLCAVSATGVGEQIVEFSAASTVCAYMEAGLSLDQAVELLFRKAKRAHAEFGVIALNRAGHIVAKTTTQHLIWAAASKRGWILPPLH